MNSLQQRPQQEEVLQQEFAGAIERAQFSRCEVPAVFPAGSTDPFGMDVAGVGVAWGVGMH